MEVDFELAVVDAEEGHLVSLSGELDILNAQRVRDTLVKVAGSTVIVDLSDLTFIDSTGIGSIVQARKQILAKGDELELRGATDAVRRVFALTGLAHLLSD